MQNIKKNYVLQVSYQILNMVLPFVTSPYISRVLGADALGIYSYAFSIASTFVLFINWGIVNYGCRECSLVRDDKRALSIFFCNLFTMRALVSLIPIFLYIFYIVKFADNKIIFLTQGILLLGAVIDINWLFWGIEEFKITVTRNFVAKILVVGLTFLLVQKQEDLWIYALIMSGGTVISQSVVWINVRKVVYYVKPQIQEIRKHIRPMLILFVAVLANSIYLYADKIMLGVLSTYSQLGYCENSYKVISFPMGLITSLGIVMMPRMSLIYGKSKEQAGKLIDKSMKYSLILAVAMCFGVMAVADAFAIVFWGKEYAECGNVIKIVAPSFVFMTWNEVLRSQFLIPNGYDKIYTIGIIWGGMTNCILNAISIPRYGARGAALATVITYASITIYQTVKCTGQLPFKKYIKSLFVPLCIGVIMYSAVSLIDCGEYLMVTLVCKMIVGAIIYCTIMGVYLYVTKDDLMRAVIRRLILRG